MIKPRARSTASLVETVQSISVHRKRHLPRHEDWERLRPRFRSAWTWRDRLSRPEPRTASGHGRYRVTPSGRRDAERAVTGRENPRVLPDNVHTGERNCATNAGIANSIKGLAHLHAGRSAGHCDGISARVSSAKRRQCFRLLHCRDCVANQGGAPVPVSLGGHRGATRSTGSARRFFEASGAVLPGQSDGIAG